MDNNYLFYDETHEIVINNKYHINKHNIFNSVHKTRDMLKFFEQNTPLLKSLEELKTYEDSYYFIKNIINNNNKYYNYIKIKNKKGHCFLIIKDLFDEYKISKIKLPIDIQIYFTINYNPWKMNIVNTLKYN